ncbi:MAG: ATP-binding protein [Caldimonas sp.]
MLSTTSLLRLLFEQAPDFIVAFEGPEHVFTLANASYYRLVGDRELIGRPLAVAIPEAADQGFVAILDGVLASRQPFVGKGVPVRLARTPGGPPEQRFVDFVYQPVMDAAGQAIGIVVEGHDITEHVEAEQRARTEAAQHEAKSRVFDIVLSSIDDFAYTFDRAHRFTYANKGLLDLLGLTLDGIVGKTFSELPYPTELAARLDEQIETVFTTGAQSRGETFYASPTGQSGWYEYIFNPVPEADGSLVTVAGSTRDITSRVQQGAQLAALAVSERAARAAAEDANRFKDEFLATLSHELRTPLNAILGWSEMLRTGTLTPTQTADAAKRISHNARAQARLIADLLDMNGIVSGKVHLRLQSVPLAPTIMAALDAVRVDAMRKGVALHGPVGDVPSQVDCDPDRLQQVLWNLLTNAVKFTPAGGSVEVGVRAEDASVVVYVTDTGIGLAADFLPRLFDRFAQADSSSTRRYSGLGLGLSISRSLVEMHGGTIAATSAGPGLGTTFRVTLPFRQPRSAASAAAGHSMEFDETLPGTDELSELRDASILVVDDDDENRAVMIALLGRFGAAATGAGNAAEAMAALQAEVPALVLCDIGMPDADGYALLQRMREVSTALPVIALTAFARPEDRQAALASGFDDHIAKPAEPASAVKTCAAVIARARDIRD